MTDYPSLGFDPARGNVTTVEDLAKQIKDTGTYAKEAYESIKAVQDNRDVWTGEAARAFAGKLGELPKYLDDAHASMEMAGKALADWADRLDAHQKEARRLEEECRQAIAEARKADAALEQTQAKDVPIAYDASNPESARNAQAQADANAQAVRSAQTAATDAWGRVEQLRRDAETLRDRREDDGGTCADRLNEAAEKAPDKGFFESFGEMFEDFGKWFEDHIGDIGDIAGIVSAVAGVLAFIPVLTPIMAPVALAAGAVALTAHGTDMVVNEKWDDPEAWSDLAGDAIGLIPGARAVGAGLRGAGEGIQAAETVVDVGRAVSSSVGSKLTTEMAEMVNPGKMYQWVADRALGGSALLDTATATNVAKALETSVTLTPQVPTAIGLFDKTEANENAKAATGYGDTGISILSEIAERGIGR